MTALGQSTSRERAPEWLFTAMMATWGAWLWLPFDTFASPQYALLKAIAGETMWGAFSIGVAFVRAVALWINGDLEPQTPIARFVCAALGALWWLVLMFLFWSAPNPNPPAGLSWYPVFLVAELLIVRQCAADAWHSGAFRNRRRRLAAG